VTAAGQGLQMVLDLGRKLQRGAVVPRRQSAARELGGVRLRQIGDAARRLCIGERIAAPGGSAVTVAAGALDQILTSVGGSLAVALSLSLARRCARLHRGFSRRAGHAALLAVMQRPEQRGPEGTARLQVSTKPLAKWG